MNKRMDVAAWRTRLSGLNGIPTRMIRVYKTSRGLQMTANDEREGNCNGRRRSVTRRMRRCESCCVRSLVVRAGKFDPTKLSKSVCWFGKMHLCPR